MMNCPFLYGTYLLSCKSSRDVYVPSAFELEEYCKSRRHKICPYYCKVMSDGTFNLMTIDRMQKGCQPGK